MGAKIREKFIFEVGLAMKSLLCYYAICCFGEQQKLGSMRRFEKMKKTKKQLNVVMRVLLVVAMVFVLAACNKESKESTEASGTTVVESTAEATSQESSEEATSEEITSEEVTTEDEETEETTEEDSDEVEETEETEEFVESEIEATIVGEGATEFTLEVIDGEGNATYFAVNTDAKTVGEALVDCKLIEGEDSEYGLYVKTVNGITADYDVDQTYWAFYINGEYAMTGVDSTEVVEDCTYSFKVEK